MLIKNRGFKCALRKNIIFSRRRYTYEYYAGTTL